MRPSKNGDVKPPSPVRTKADFVRRYKAGEFGNRSPTWDDLGTYLASGYSGLVHIRNRIAGAETWYNVERAQTAVTWKQAVEKYGPGNLYISAMAPHDKNLLQGEVQQTPNGLYLFSSRAVGLPMRDALKTFPEHDWRVVALEKLKFFLCPNSFDWLQYLLYAYPSHVVEFSTFTQKWGTLPNYNTTFWEVRLY